MRVSQPRFLRNSVIAIDTLASVTYGQANLWSYQIEEGSPMTPYQPDSKRRRQCVPDRDGFDHPAARGFRVPGFLEDQGHIAGLAGLAAAILVAILAFGMPVDLSLLAASQGFVYGLFPIMWIVVAAIWLYQLTVVSGRFEDLRTAFNRVSDDPRIQGIIIAFCFGGLLEALAGFGAPVAITGVMLVSLGFSADARRGHRAAGQHRPGRVRRHRHPDHHRRQPDRHRLPRDRRRRRSADPAARRVRAAVAGVDRGRQTRHQADLARRPSSPVSPSPSPSSSAPTTSPSN